MIIYKKRLSQIRRTQNDSYQKEEIFTDDHWQKEILARKEKIFTDDHE